MTSYSIDHGYENINHPKTKEYFGEVMQSYVNGSNRSAVVMLYSVVVSDLIYKLKDLKDLYEDKSAIEILEKIEKLKRSNPKSSEWETKLIEEVGKKTFLLESLDKVNLEHLRNQRHLSAHPVLNGTDLLSTPNRETVRALMRNMLEGILTKGAVMGKEIFTLFIEDLAEHTNHFVNSENLENYLEARYFKNINQQTIKKIFRSLWTVTFNLQDELCKKNRNINYLALKIIYKKYRSEMKEYIESDVEYFSRTFNSKAIHSLEFLFAMLGHFPEIYKLMSKDSQKILQSLSSIEWSLRVKSTFLVDDFLEHVESLIHDLYSKKYKKYEISHGTTKFLVELSEKEGARSILNELLIKYFVSSGSFIATRSNYEKFIEPYLGGFEASNLESILEGIDTNSQCYENHLAAQYNSEIRKRANFLNVKIDYKTRFPNVVFTEDENLEEVEKYV